MGKRTIGPMIEPYTVTLTSCARFDLLERTLASLLPRLEGPCERIVIGEDSGDRRVLEAIERFRSDAPPIHVLLNPRRLGICRNIDRIYAEVGTEWIFHCEDDWEFYRSGFIRESFEAMQDASISSVSLQDISEFRSGYWGPAGDSHYVATDAVAGRFAGLRFALGLRRMSDYRTVGPYGELVADAREDDVSLAYLSEGKRIALLKRPAVRHIGWGRHVSKTRAPSARIFRNARKLFSWLGIGPPTPSKRRARWLSSRPKSN